LLSCFNTFLGFALKQKNCASNVFKDNDNISASGLKCLKMITLLVQRPNYAIYLIHLW